MTPLVVFDIDLTLISTNGAGRAAINRAFMELFDVADPTAGVRFDGRTDRAIFAEVIASQRSGEEEAETFERVKARYLALLPGSLVEKGGRVLPGVEAVLDALGAARAALGLATGNFEAGAAAKLKHFGLWDSFIGGGFGDATPVRADVVEVALRNVAAAAGLTANEARPIVIGDTPLDVEAAHAVGVPALAVATGSFTVEQLREGGADYVLPDLADTERVLAILLG